MSWSFQVLIVPVERFEEAAKAALEANRGTIEQYNRDGLPSAELALTAAIDLVKTGIVGTGNVTAYLSGHGNPDHLAPKGWSKDTVTIQLSRTDA